MSKPLLWILLYYRVQLPDRIGVGHIHVYDVVTHHFTISICPYISLDCYPNKNDLLVRWKTVGSVLSWLLKLGMDKTLFFS